VTTGPFEDPPVIGTQSRTHAAVKLREMDEDKAAEAIERAAPAPVTMRGADWRPFRDRAWQLKAHSIGVLPAGDGAGTQKILGIGDVGASLGAVSSAQSRRAPSHPYSRSAPRIAIWKL
jgi:hypothetical protein